MALYHRRLRAVSFGLLLVSFVTLGACKDPTEPEGTPVPDLSGPWTVKLWAGRFVGATYVEGLCELDGLLIALATEPDTTGEIFRAATVSGSHQGGELVCTGVTEDSLPAPFLADTVLTIAPGSIEGSIYGRCSGPSSSGFCGDTWVPAVELRLLDTAPVSSDGLHFHVDVSDDHAASTYLAGDFTLSAVQVEECCSYERQVLTGRWHATR